MLLTKCIDDIKVSFFHFSVCTVVVRMLSQWTYIKQWDARFGGTDADLLTRFLECHDGGFLLTGYSQSVSGADKTQTLWGGSSDDDFWIVKTDASGNKEWDKDFGGYFSDRMFSVKEIPSGGYLLAGESISGISGNKTQPTQGNTDWWIVRIDSAGNKLWDKDFGGPDYDYLNSMIATSDGGYLLGGISLSSAGGDKTQNTWGGWDFWIIKIDSAGNKLWDKDYGGTDHDYLNDISQTSDGGFLIGGYSLSDISGDKTQSRWGLYDFWIIKTDSVGNLEWEKDYGGYDNDYLNSVLPVSGGYILAGISSSGTGGNKTQPSWGGLDFWILKIDFNGNLVYDRDYGGTDDEDFFGNISSFPNGDLLLAGISYSPISGTKTENNLGIEQSYIMRIDSIGNIVWDKTIFTNGHDEEGYAIITSDGCIAVANYTNGNAGGYKSQDNRDTVAPYVTADYWLVKFCDSTQAGLPVAAFTSQTQVCPGACIAFTNLSQNSISYQWNFPGGMPSTSTDIEPNSICYSTAGTYDVQLIATGSAGSDTLVLNNYITVFPSPLPQSISQNGDTLLADNGYATYQWYFNGSMISGATDYFYIAPQSGNYSVVATDENGCEVEAVINNVMAGMNQLAVGAGVSGQLAIYPNPAQNKITIMNLSSGETNIEIVNLLGDVLYKDRAANNSKEIDLDNFSAGVYVVKVSNENSERRIKFIKE
jgi:PKD repeat protein